MAHKTSDGYKESGLYVLTTNRTVEGELLTGKFYRQMWKDGETTTPMSKKDATRIARIRGVGFLPWEDSKAYKAIMDGTVQAKADVEDVEKASEGVFAALKKAAGVKAAPKKKTRKKASK